MNEFSQIVSQGGKKMSDIVTNVIGIIFKLVLIFFIIGIIVGYIVARYFLT